jgi:hypothetical protein
MDDLFKLIFYVIMVIVWVISSARKQAEQDKENSKLANKTPLKPKIISNFEPEPEAEGDFFTESVNDPLIRFGISDYNQQLDIIKKQMQIKKTPLIIEDAVKEPLIIDEPEEMPELEQIQPSITPIVRNLRQKKSYHLKSSLKEGIIWSIVLGAPRSKQTFNWSQIPLNR